jgi:hypothetical protein
VQETSIQVKVMMKKKEEKITKREIVIVFTRLDGQASLKSGMQIIPFCRSLKLFP